MSTLVECVPNFSEGRDKTKVDAIVEAMKVEGVYLLDREMDADHNRCVITLVGNREAIAEAAIRGVGKAAELIDLTKHQGAHPRMGAADVVPFIPIEGVSLEDCVQIARQVGQEIWKRYEIPIYFYDAAAMMPERQNLENIRRGQFEGIRAEIETNPARKPDVGEARVHPTAGATVVGARKALIAYNVFLNTTDVDIAKKIAKAVRFSSGGLRYVKGAGFPGARSGAGLDESDGLRADADRTRVRVREARGCSLWGDADQQRNRRLDSKEGVRRCGGVVSAGGEFRFVIDPGEPTECGDERQDGRGGLRAGVEPFIEQLAAPTSAPGGGSASAAAAAMAAGLANMVATMSRGKKAYVQYESQLSEAIARLSVLREELKVAIEADTEAFNVVMKAYKAAKDASDGQQGINGALKQATLVPMGVAERAKEVGKIAEKLRPITNPNMASDLTVSQALSDAAVTGALANVEINLGSITDEVFVEEVRGRVKAIAH